MGRANRFARLCLAALTCLPLAARADTGSNELTLTSSFQLSASVQAGCVLGSGSADATSFGSIDFGQLAGLGADVKAASSVSGGSIQLQCTPGTDLTISLNNGANGVSGVRYMAKGSERLRYQLYQDASYSTVWGDQNAGTPMSMTFPAGGTLSLPVYARLFATSPLPSAGLYSDVVTVTVTY
ncbi:spore coat U domain-containing protein [Pseudomonas sp.]|uniref:Csu type fimbrial protein n=1 Tax=Pseudomonas sp. TaxID=306 RepID=UPI0028ADE1AA|nr:spore coat U domain-containing protein [Pseudomonas sp.]